MSPDPLQSVATILILRNEPLHFTTKTSHCRNSKSYQNNLILIRYPRGRTFPTRYRSAQKSSKIVFIFRKFGMSVLGGLLAEHFMILAIFQSAIDSPTDIGVDMQQAVSIWIDAYGTVRWSSSIVR